jgi:hypothetical protein
LAEEKKITKSMLIIKSDANSLRGVEQFLKNRDWHLISTHQMKDAILNLVKHKPSFVLVTVDHPHPKMRKLPKIISSAFPSCVMVYAEKATTASFKLLMDSGIEYKINPPVTGPAIERAVNKFIRDQEQAQRQQAETAANDPAAKNNFEFQVEVKSGGEKQSGIMSIKGEGGAPGSIGMNGDASGASSGDAAAAAEQNSLAMSLLAQLGGDDGDASGASGGSAPGFNPLGSQTNKNSEGGIINFQTANQEKAASGNASQIALETGTLRNGQNAKAPGEFTLDPEKMTPEELAEAKKKKRSSGGGPFGESFDEDSSGEAGSLGALGGRKKSKTGQPDDQVNGAGEDVLIGNARNKKSGAAGAFTPTGTPNDLYVPPNSAGEPGELGSPKSSLKSVPAKIVGRNDEDPNNPKNLTKADSLRVRRNGFFSEESLLVKGVNQSLDDSVVKGSGEVQANLEDNSHLACIIVESTKFSGYLVAALGKDKKLDQNFVELVKLRLIKFLQENGEPIENEANLQLKVRRVDFEGWALEYAQFLRKSVHKGDEVAMAFFPFADAQTKVGESATPTMVSVKTEDIQTEVPLEFNMYIYLPTNKKYILYTPQGGVFLSEQKARLTRQGVGKMHIQKEDVQNLSKFKAQNHLNSLIKDYEKNQTVTAANSSGENKTSKKKKAA